ncbi:hypothetical protein FRC09_010433 [Ceratobasidium sp. 395]|nr:hypothetical protein FRC09_010433 [Ceratobasidium sp. 395]
MPAIPQPPGQVSVWQADARSDFSHQQSRHGSGSLVDNSRPWIHDPGSLYHLVPASEREGVNQDGIPRHIAWLAKHGYTTHSYQEIVAARASRQPPKPTRKDIEEELRIEQMKLQEVLKNVPKGSSRSRRRAKDLGPAMVMAPRGEHAVANQPAQPPQDSHFDELDAEAIARDCENAIIDTSAWLDSFQQQQRYDSAFGPAAALPPASVYDGVNGFASTSAPEDQYAHAYNQSGYQQPYFSPDGYSALQPRFPSYPGTNGYSSYDENMPASSTQMSQRGAGTYAGQYYQQY